MQPPPLPCSLSAFDHLDVGHEKPRAETCRTTPSWNNSPVARTDGPPAHPELIRQPVLADELSPSPRLQVWHVGADVAAPVDAGLGVLLLSPDDKAVRVSPLP